MVIVKRAVSFGPGSDTSGEIGRTQRPMKGRLDAFERRGEK